MNLRKDAPDAMSALSDYNAEKGAVIRAMFKNWHFWIAVVLFAAAICRFWQLDTIPTGYNNDEMGTAYDAWSLLNYLSF